MPSAIPSSKGNRWLHSWVFGGILQRSPSEKDKPKPNRTAKLSYKEQRELDALPDEIAALEAEQAALNAQLSAPEIFKDYEKAGSLQARAEEIETLLLEKLERWEMLEAKQNGG